MEIRPNQPEQVTANMYQVHNLSQQIHVDINAMNDSDGITQTEHEKQAAMHTLHVITVNV